MIEKKLNLIVLNRRIHKYQKEWLDRTAKEWSEFTNNGVTSSDLLRSLIDDAIESRKYDIANQVK